MNGWGDVLRGQDRVPSGVTMPQMMSPSWKGRIRRMQLRGRVQTVL